MNDNQNQYLLPAEDFSLDFTSGRPSQIQIENAVDYVLPIKIIDNPKIVENENNKDKNKMQKEKERSEKNAWSDAENAKLIELVSEHGPKKWSIIAQSLPGRIGKQCRERWHNHLSPQVRKEAWTLEEDALIFSKHRALGNQWAEISKSLPGRTDNSIKNRFYSTLRRKQRQAKKLGLPVDQVQIFDEDITQLHSSYNNNNNNFSLITPMSVDDSNPPGIPEAQISMITKPPRKKKAPKRKSVEIEDEDDEIEYVAVGVPKARDSSVREDNSLIIDSSTSLKHHQLLSNLFYGEDVVSLEKVKCTTNKNTVNSEKSIKRSKNQIDSNNQYLSNVVKYNDFQPNLSPMDHPYYQLPHNIPTSFNPYSNQGQQDYYVPFSSEVIAFSSQIGNFTSSKI